jgi:hypothetical protein
MLSTGMSLATKCDITRHIKYTTENKATIDVYFNESNFFKYENGITMQTINTLIHKFLAINTLSGLTCKLSMIFGIKSPITTK